MKPVPRHLVTLQKVHNGEYSEFLLILPCDSQDGGWALRIERYVQRWHPTACETKPVRIRGECAGEWTLGGTWGIKTTTRLVARAWPVQEL